ncbi:MAG TPA: EAL domain-containing protein [Pyrinomonadaceae bacterium]|nr:EAL domain-containing protein [Pyrinomonadaceae bacterium]
MLHSLLKRQLKKCGADALNLPTFEQWREFLNRVDRFYTEADQERYLLERSLEISSKEMQDVYEQLRRSEARYALAAQGANDGLWDWDLVTDEVYYSPRWVEIMGIIPQEDKSPCKDCWFERIHPDDREIVIEELNAHLQGFTHHFENEHRILHGSDEYRWVLIRGLAVKDESGKALRIAGSLTDVNERKRAEEKLEHDAVHDALTGLPNRKCLMTRLARSLDRKKHGQNYNFATLFIDLDRFKTINDSMGHQAGDELLLSITEKLQKVVRPSDMVARLGGDEFVVLLETVSNQQLVEQIADRIQAELQQPITINGQEIYSSASIGIVLGTNDYDTPDDLVRDADMAMYRAKTKGKARYEIFDPQVHAGAVSQLQLEIDLRRAIERREFVLHYQPIISLDSETMIGFESLIRWQHPERGMVPPNDFIPVAEETGLILYIGQWVLYESCRQMREWQDKFDLKTPLIVSVNLSARQLEQKDLIMQIEHILYETRFDPRNLKLEITESVIMNNAEQAAETVNQLREMGIRVSIDDFGTGYSSLSYLHHFPIDTLKVDRSFINRIGAEKENGEIVQTIINLAYNLGMEVVAEGVETAEQLDFLREIQCGYCQGFFYSRPVNSDTAAEMISDLVETKEFAIPPILNQIRELAH